MKNEQQRLDLLEPFQANLKFDQAERTFAINGIVYTLEIDRIDQTQDGRNLIIYYYNSADLGTVERIAKGLDFKLPLQIRALQSCIDELYPGKSLIGAGTYLVKSYRQIKKSSYFARKEFQAMRKDKVSLETPVFSGQRKYGFLPQANFKHEVDRIQQNITAIHRFIVDGRFHPPVCAEKDQTCFNCSFVVFAGKSNCS